MAYWSFYWHYTRSTTAFEEAGTSVFFYHREKKTVRDSAAAVADEILDFWYRARIPTKQRYHVIAHVEKLFDEYCKLKKNKGRQTDTQRSKESDFVTHLEELFDIAHEEAMSLITIEEEKTIFTATENCQDGLHGKNWLRTYRKRGKNSKEEGGRRETTSEREKIQRCWRGNGGTVFIWRIEWWWCFTWLFTYDKENEVCGWS